MAYAPRHSPKRSNVSFALNANERPLYDIGKDEARQARRLLADAKLHGHKYAIDAVLAVLAPRQKGQVTAYRGGDDWIGGLAHVVFQGPDGTVPVRLSVVAVRTDGAWRIRHYHVSRL